MRAYGEAPNATKSRPAYGNGGESGQKKAQDPKILG
jgi:hypothetical protein